MKWKDYNCKHNYGNTRPAGKKRNGYENAAPKLQFSFFFFFQIRGGTPRNQTWCRGWFPGGRSGEKLSLPVLGLPGDFCTAAMQGRSHPLGHPQEGSGTFLSIKHCWLQTHCTPGISSKLRNYSQIKPHIASLTRQLVSCIPPLNMAHTFG